MRAKVREGWRERTMRTTHTHKPTNTHTDVKLVLVRPTSHKGCGSLTAVIQHKVVLGIAVLLRAARYEYVVVPEEVLQAGNLEEEQ